MTLRRLAFITAVTLIFSSAAGAQTASLSGRVVDPQSGVVVNAEVILRAANAAAARSVRSGPDGTFVLEPLAPGRYSLQVEAPGFVRWTQDVVVAPDAQPMMVTLQIAGVNEDVTVSGLAPTTLTREAPTASRLGLTPLETPASIQVLTGEMIRERGDVSALDAVTRAVGVTNTATPGNGGTALGSRGFTGVDSVKQLYDGVQLIIGTGTVTFPFDSWTLDRIEVLGGPSSVLYGTGAIGGVVNVVPRKPNRAAFQHAGQVTFGSFGTRRTAIDSTGPINDRLSYRIDVSRNDTDGWVDRGDSATTAISGALRFDASPTFNVTVSNDYGLQSLAYHSGIPFINGRLDRSIVRRNYNVLDSDNYYNDGRTQVRAEWKPSGGISVRSTAYNLRADRHWRGVSTYTHQPATNTILRSTYSEIYHDTYQYGQQSDVSFKGRLFGRENTAAVGVGYDWVYFKHSNNTPVSGSSVTTIDNASPGFFINAAGTSPQWESRSTVASVFAEDRVVISRRLSAVTGLRFDRSSVDRDELRLRTSAQRTFTPISWRGGLVYNLRPEFVLYGQYATATEWVSSLASISAAQQIFDLTKGRQVEIGAKQTFMNNRGEWTLAGYRIVKNNLLVPDPLNPGVSQQVGQQSSRGVEASASVALGGGLRVDANGTVLKAQFDDFRENVSGVIISRNGNRPTNVPLRAANLWVTWDFLRQWQARSGLRFVGERFRDNANTGALPSYTLIDAGLRRRLTPKLSVDLRIYNAFDEIYVTAPRASNLDQWYLGRPRAVEVGLSANF